MFFLPVLNGIVTTKIEKSYYPLLESYKVKKYLLSESGILETCCLLIFSIVKECAYNCRCKKPFAEKICKIRLENSMAINTSFQTECTKIRHMPKFKKRKSETAR